MKAMVISGCDVIREGLIALLSRQKNITPVREYRTVEEALSGMRDDSPEIIVFCIEDEEALVHLNELKNTGEEARLLIVDFEGNNQLFVKVLQCGVQGYILGKANEKELIYAIDQLRKGKKYYDSYFVDCFISDKRVLRDRLDLLTLREREILAEIAGGMSNKKICEKLAITEHTVKKHITHIFEKLNIKDRTEAALYANRYKLE